MSIAQSLLPEFDHEIQNTRRVLERLPEDKLDFKPHEKSSTLWDLASHVSELSEWGAHILSIDELDMATLPKPARPRTSKEMLALLDQYAASTREQLLKASDDDFMRPWTLRFGSHVLMTQPKVVAFRSVVMSHIIHHRGQLTVYLRLCGVPVPGLYGPSADER